jgi:hypothetical protein
MFNIKYNIPSNLYYEIHDRLIYSYINKININKLIKYIFKAIKENKYKIEFRNTRDRLLGEYIEPNIIHISVNNLAIDQMVAVLIHEILHSIFPQIDSDKYIINLERKILKKITKKQINKLLHEVLNGQWKYSGSICKRISSPHDRTK